VFEEVQNILKARPAGKVLVQLVVTSQEDQPLYSALSGLLKTAQLENPQLVGQVIEIEPGESQEVIEAKLEENRLCPEDQWIRYQNGRRYVANWSELEPAPQGVTIPWKDGGVYLITGGAGGLGRLFAREIGQRVKKATLILTGRSSLSKEQEARLREIEELGIQIVYQQVDVADEQAVRSLIQRVQGNIDGIIHAAGIIRDNFIVNKTREQFLEVLAPKVTGLINVDQASQEQQLDFFVIFSSTAGSFGNPGQADYATANAFMDAYARYRNELVAQGQRRGRTLSINWSHWREG
jgi:polyketide synthase PksN